MPEPFEEAKNKWLASMEARVRDPEKFPTAMAPWDEQVYFQAVRETTYVTVITGTQQVAQADSMRVGIVFSLGGTDPCRLSTNPTITLSSGITLSQGVNPFVVLQKDLGNLCQIEWYALLSGMSRLTVVEIRLREFPS